MAVVALLSAGCAATEAAAPPRLVTSADCPAPATGAPAEWIVGSWRNPYYTLVLRGDGDIVRWNMARERHASARWGTKAAMRASGHVATISACTFEMVGRYDWSETPAHVGQALVIRGRHDGHGRLVGDMLGAGHEWTAISFVRAP